MAYASDRGAGGLLVGDHVSACPFGGGEGDCFGVMCVRRPE